MAEYVQPYSMYHLSFLDASNETSGLTIYMDEINAANFVALNAEKVALTTALRALTLCNPLSSGLSVAMTQYNMGVPTSAWAQRELALQVSFVDTVNGRKQTLTIPGVDWETYKGDGDFIDYNNVLWAAFKTAFELTARSFYGNPVQIVSARFVGRRS